ncbi:tetratricopeptide repeat protein [Streptomyces fructofermentans]|uniref:tetratricopeptide repeat protein n=1 Tax=Streptomyces fructofermentans TaxID=152141 RepID=UPI0037A078F8
MPRADHEPDPSRAERLITRLVRAARHTPAAGPVLTTVVGTQPDLLLPVALGAARAGHGPVDDALAQAVVAADLDVEALLQLNASLPWTSSALGHTALAIAEQACRKADGSSTHAHSLLTLGLRLSEVGRHSEAVTAMREAVAQRRSLAEDDPDTHNPGLAAALSNRGAWLSGAGRYLEALAAAEESVALYRRLADVDPDAHGPDLATALSSLGIRLSDVGLHREALNAAEEAVAVWQSLAESNAAAYRPSRAKALNNLGNLLSNVGRTQEAQTAFEEARRLSPP